ncbi:MAG: hypothetical protein ACOX4I_08935 [Anaerovoracaceae bacterium]|jgi:hypothetical protein
MTVSAADRNRLLSVNVREHGHIVDLYCAQGRDPETIAIRLGIDLELIILILRAYNVKLGSDWGDEEDDRGAYKRIPEKIVKKFVAEYYPGILRGRPETTLADYMMGGRGSDD